MIKEIKPFTPSVLPEFLQSIHTDTFFFDIETTGFSPKTAHLYMIGACYMDNNQWYAIQWFDEVCTIDSEKELLMDFSNFALQYSSCITYNGTTFDFPFIEKKCRTHNILSPLSHLNHTDIYRQIYPYSSLFKLNNMKQKSIEAFLGIGRQDKYSGGQLIKVYKDFIRTGSEKLKNLLFLHNLEDICGMTDLLPITAYPDFFKGHFKVIDSTVDNTTLTIYMKPDRFILMPLNIHSPYYELQLSANTAVLSVPIVTTTLKFFYDNYKDYYYLPAEDEAIHKSVGTYVDPSCRIRATKETCYTKKSDYFLAQPKPWFSPVYKETATSTLYYFTLDTLKNKPDLMKAYVSHLLPFYEK